MFDSWCVAPNQRRLRIRFGLELIGPGGQKFVFGSSGRALIDRRRAPARASALRFSSAVISQTTRCDMFNIFGWRSHVVRISLGNVSLIAASRAVCATFLRAGMGLRRDNSCCSHSPSSRSCYGTRRHRPRSRFFLTSERTGRDDLVCGSNAAHPLFGCPLTTALGCDACCALTVKRGVSGACDVPHRAIRYLARPSALGPRSNKCSRSWRFVAPTLSHTRIWRRPIPNGIELLIELVSSRPSLRWPASRAG